MSCESEPRICQEGWCGLTYDGGMNDSGEYDWCEQDPKMCALYKANCIRLGKEWPPKNEWDGDLR